jgi:hypothetical protein
MCGVVVTIVFTLTLQKITVGESPWLKTEMGMFPNGAR